MQQGNNYHRFGYQPFSDYQSSSSAPQPGPQGYGQPQGGYNDRMAGYDDIAPMGGSRFNIVGMMSSPLAMTGALIAAAVVFAGILVASYPSSDDVPQPIPIVQAESGPLKSAPDEAGGMEIANNDTTVFEAIDGKKSGARPVENLLETASSDEAPMSKEELVAQLKVQEAETPSAELADVPSEISRDLKAPVAASSAPVARTPAQLAEASAKGIPLPRPEKTGEKLAAKGPDAEPAVPMHEPGASPETIAFVRSVLDKKDGKSVQAAAPVPAPAPALIPPSVSPQEMAAADIARIEPSSGTPAPVAVSRGTSYVQVVSVPSRSAAESEWSKIQSSLASVISGAPHRIQEANLGEKGTYYRVQLGPYDEAGAKSLCEQIKTLKPGGCFIVR